LKKEFGKIAWVFAFSETIARLVKHYTTYDGDRHVPDEAYNHRLEWIWEKI